MSTRLDLLPLEALVRTSEVDHADWNYRPVLGLIQRRRFRIVLSLLGSERYRKLLEVGYGSGVFMPELAKRCEELFGIDPHSKNEEVTDALIRSGLRANLFSGSVTEMPLEDEAFDAVVIVSAIEYVDDIHAACVELKRVMTRNGVLVLVTPGHSPVVDVGLKLLTGESAEENYGERRKRLLPTLTEHFVVEQRVDFPPIIHPIVKLYTGLRLRPRV